MPSTKKEFCSRKPNRLPDFDYGSNGAYFVTICTEKRRNILSNIVGDGFPVPKRAGMIAETFIQMLPAKYPCARVDKYVIMPDHIHMILFIENVEGTGNPSPTLENIIGWYKYGVTKRINTEMGTSAERVFQRSYYDHVIRGEQDYVEIWEYIENNPRKRVLDRQV